MDVVEMIHDVCGEEESLRAIKIGAVREYGASRK